MTTTTDAEDVDQLRSVLREFLAARASSERVRTIAESPEPFDADLWQQMVEELGLPGLAVPEECGGGGFDGTVQLAVFEELGASLACVPYLSTVGLAIPALLASPANAIRNDLLAGLASGEKTATVALTPTDGAPSAYTHGVTARADDQTGDAVHLDGRKGFVVDGDSADLILVPARAGDDVCLYVVEREAAGLARTPMRTLDLTRPMSMLEFASTPARRVSDTDATVIVDAALDVANAMVAAEQLGGAQRCLDMAVQYAAIREQFGRPIGSFQAIKHKCADMLVAVESARSAVDHLAQVLRGDTARLSTSAPLAKAYCSDAYVFVAGENVQVHGGIGFTWEHDAHMYLRRAHSSAILNGDSSFQRGVLADRLGF
ncbi:acyl-CoA dehydrogenase family protein [Mycolicibacterium porcinum]|uniref:Acyl-CoA/acyl-ACP dehydrogenase n=1 Tax=Mycolicibacterium porcinum TaxID=39693 RepID=A0AAW5SX13_9MYCO|nr:acyl-CoA dehydrogenase family protein [Mycolicibacterium porcinum]MCV7386475.1 acyl-CoA/acyl-ACP dehydrogenase [Mycolicibacterium porcinum]ORB39031.1 hypothetical protein BST41_18620 [Mycolicibacterium porcinum]CDO30855.1 acyl-CoA dehydrogenase [Mycolicibacterium vulneris]